MLDLHCHLLPGVDDGAPDLQVALEMAAALAAVGFRQVAPSPHLGAGPGGDVAPALAAEKREELAAALIEAEIPIELLPNAEHHVTPELFDRIADDAVVPIGGTTHWLLTELPWRGLADPEGVLFRLQTKGFRLLLAHPERHGYLELDVIERLVQRGVRCQLELGSFVGMFGRSIQDQAELMMDRGLVHVLASDLHRPRDAETWLRQAFEVVTKRWGAAALQRGVADNPGQIVADAAVDAVGALGAEA